MAPVRRYLRISRYTVLEVRIYLDNPSDAHRWLLRPGNPALPRVIEAVRPLVLPKLREENDRAKKGGKKKGVKDVVARDDFEASIFLTSQSTPHSILTKQRLFVDKATAEDDPSDGTKDAPVQVDDDGPPALREEDGDPMDLSAIPAAAGAAGLQADGDDAVQEVEDGSEPEDEPPDSQEHTQDDKKKPGLTTSYEGFRIYGRVLCLVVKRLNSKKGQSADDGTGQAMLEQWISSTQDNAGPSAD